MSDLEIVSTPSTLSQTDAAELGRYRFEEKQRQAARQAELEARVAILEERLAAMTSSKTETTQPIADAVPDDAEPSLADTQKRVNRSCRSFLWIVFIEDSSQRCPSLFSFDDRFGINLLPLGGGRGPP